MAACKLVGCENDIPQAKRVKQQGCVDDLASHLIEIECELCEELLSMTFPEPVSVIYNPLDYAADTHRSFVHKYGNSTKDVLFLGMNPGPFGMAQNGVSLSVGGCVTGGRHMLLCVCQSVYDV